MRIALCTKNDLFGAIVLNHVLPALHGHDRAVFLSVRERPAFEDAVPELDLLRLLERQVPLDLLFPLLEAGPPGRFLTPKRLAAAHGCPLNIISDNTPEGGTRTIEAFGADMILSIRFSWLFRRSTIERTAGGIINVHPGPLPAYRGLFAPFWQIVRGETRLRCSVHLVDPGVDTGPILSVVEIPLTPGRSLLWHMVQMYLAGAGRAVDYVHTGLPPALPQDQAAAGRNGLPEPADFARFAAAGFALARGQDYRDLLLPFLPTGAAA